MTRRHLLSCFAATGLGGSLYAFGIEPQWLELVQQPILIPGRGLASPVRILHLSDLHASRWVPFSLIEKAVSVGLQTRPDLICLTGDFITSDEAVDERRYQAILRRLSSAAPTYACLGNHDGGPWAYEKIGGFPDSSLVRGILASGGGQLLHNRSEVVRIRETAIQVVGVGDLWNDQIDAPQAFAAATRTDIPTVLLSHNPDSKEVVEPYSWDLMLSGHTHGGQVLVPVVGTRFVAVKDKRFVAGLHSWKGRQVYVTRGVGSLGGVRVNCRPEVTLLTLAA